MPSLDNWLATENIAVMDAETRAALAWRRIQDRPSSIYVRRGATNIAAQTVRVEYDNTARLDTGMTVTRSVQRVIVFGVRDHATVADTNIQRSDTFKVGDVRYEVISVLLPPGEVQAIAEGSQGT